jgi:hypothetical protein
MSGFAWLLIIFVLRLYAHLTWPMAWSSYPKLRSECIVVRGTNAGFQRAIQTACCSRLSHLNALSHTINKPNDKPNSHVQSSCVQGRHWGSNMTAWLLTSPSSNWPVRMVGWFDMPKGVFTNITATSNAFCGAVVPTSEGQLLVVGGHGDVSVGPCVCPGGGGYAQPKGKEMIALDKPGSPCA